MERREGMMFDGVDNYVSFPLRNNKEPEGLKMIQKLRLWILRKLLGKLEFTLFIQDPMDEFEKKKNIISGSWWLDKGEVSCVLSTNDKRIDNMKIGFSITEQGEVSSHYFSGTINNPKTFHQTLESCKDIK